MTEPRFDSVRDALENSPAEAADMKARAGVMIAIGDAVDGGQLSQAEAASLLGVTQRASTVCCADGSTSSAWMR